MIHITCRLTAKNWNQLRNPTLSNRAWATFTFTVVELSVRCVLVVLWNVDDVVFAQNGQHYMT